MSIENAKAFYEKVRADQGLQQKIGERAKGDPAEMETAIIKVAEENGYPFTLEEMRTVLKETAEKALKSVELSDAELEVVAGGTKGAWIGYSIVSFGTACAISAIWEAATNNNCPILGKHD
jgi:predicted ribosomally synthesized peptide with nif11-like leader